MKDLSGDFKCPNCHKAVKFKIKELVPGTSRPCPHCQASFKFTGDDGREIQREFDDLKKLNMTFRF